jgi:endoglucanase
MRTLHRSIIRTVFLSSVIIASTAHGYYTTKGQDIIDRKTGGKVLLQGFGLGCWLLPEGYMWGLRKLDRPRQLEEAIVDLIGPQDAAEFWRLYHDNFVTEDDIKAMKAWGVNSVRIALLASMLQPRDGRRALSLFRRRIQLSR